MPLLQTTSPGVSIYYKLHSIPLFQEGTDAFRSDGRPKVLLLMGFAASHQAWAPQLADLLVAPPPLPPAPAAAATTTTTTVAPPATDGDSAAAAGAAAGGAGGTASPGAQQPPPPLPMSPSPMVVCVLDNRGVGRSSSPTEHQDYSTATMAGDALQVMDHLCWHRFHVVGHSLGGMIACKLAAAAPQRVLSLSILSATGGGWQAVPKSLRALWLGIKMLLARSAEARAAVDVRFHFSPSLLREADPGTGQSRQQQLVQEYVAALAAAPPQPPHGMRGQLGAVMGHRVRRREVRAIQSGQFPILVLHGREDIIALPRYGRQLAARLEAPLLELPGGHFVMREQAAAVNSLLRSFILGHSFLNVERYPFLPFHHWVDVVNKHREKARQVEPQQQLQQQQQDGRPTRQSSSRGGG